jgi:putative hydrolase of the HAD superfamily
MAFLLQLPPGILFDLDDTIVAYDLISRDIWKEVVELWCDKTPLGDPSRILEQISSASRWFWSDAERHRIGRNDQTAARRTITRLAFEALGIDQNDVSVAIADEYSVRRLEAMFLFPGAVETLQRLKDSGVKLSLITNGEGVLQRGKIIRFGLEPYFDSIFVEGELGYGKPEERVYLEAAASLNLSPQQCWIVGDNLEWEVKVPKKLGFFTVWNDCRNRGVPQECNPEPDLVVTSIAEILENVSVRGPL